MPNLCPFAGFVAPALALVLEATFEPAHALVFETAVEPALALVFEDAVEPAPVVKRCRRNVLRHEVQFHAFPAEMHGDPMDPHGGPWG